MDAKVGCREIPVGELIVSVYIDVECTEDKWDLIYKPVIECPYYLTLDKDDRKIHDKYVSIAERRDPNWGKSPRNTYEHLKELYDDIKKNGYNPKKAEHPMKVWKGTKVLEDGHHRAAILCKLYGPQYIINVEEGSSLEGDKYPPDHYRCSNPCKE